MEELLNFSELKNAFYIYLIIFTCILVFLYLFKDLIHTKRETNTTEKINYEKQKEKTTNNLDTKNIKNPTNEQYIKKYIKDYNEKKFKKEAYDIFLKIQEARINLDTSNLDDLIDGDLLDEYERQIKFLKDFNRKNIMTDFKQFQFDITNFGHTNDKFVIETQLNIAFYDYTIDTKNNDLISGNKIYKTHRVYRLVYIGSLKNDKYCEHCRGPIKTIKDNKCNYCSSPIQYEIEKWELMTKETLYRS